MKFYIVLFLMLLASSPVWAQSPAEPQLPQGPLLSRVPAPAAWTITTQGAPDDSDAGSPQPPTGAAATNPIKPRITQVIKGQNLIFEKVIAENGSLIEMWRIGGLAVMNPDNSGWIISPGGGTTFNTTDYSEADFAGFDWISLHNFSGVRDVQGKHCITFKDRVITLDPQEVAMIQAAFNNSAANEAARERQEQQNQHLKNPSPTPDKPVPTYDVNSLKVDVEADIDNETRLPVQLTYKTVSGKTMIRTYSFQAPSGSLSLPREVQSLIKSYQDRQQRMTGKSAPI